jgi:hypothetical protein
MFCSLPSLSFYFVLLQVASRMSWGFLFHEVIISIAEYLIHVPSFKV